MSATQETIREEPAVSDPDSDQVGAPAGSATREDFADASDDLQVEGAERAIASAERERAERRERQTEPPPKAREDMSDTDVTATMEDTNEVSERALSCVAGRTGDVCPIKTPSCVPACA